MEDKIIVAVCGYPELYDTSSYFYRNRNKKDLAWKKDVFLMIRHHKTTILTDAKESTTVYELKRIVEGILKRSPEEQKLYKDEQPLEDSKMLGDCGFTNQTARPEAPATVGLAFRVSDESFEPLQVEPFSCPPELPDVMKPQDLSTTVMSRVGGTDTTTHHD